MLVIGWIFLTVPNFELSVALHAGLAWRIAARPFSSKSSRTTPHAAAMLVLVDTFNAAASKGHDSNQILLPVLISMMGRLVTLDSTNDMHAEVYSLCLRHYSCFALRTARMISLALF